MNGFHHSKVGEGQAVTFRNTGAPALTGPPTTTLLRIPRSVSFVLLYCNILLCLSPTLTKCMVTQIRWWYFFHTVAGFVDFVEHLHVSSCSLSLCGLNGQFRRKKKPKRAITVEQGLSVKTTCADTAQSWVMDGSIVTMKVSITLRDSHVGEGFTHYSTLMEDARLFYEW